MIFLVALPLSLFKIVQGLCFPRKSNVCSFGPWSLEDFSTSQNIHEKIIPSTDIVLIPIDHPELGYVLEQSKHIDYKFNIVVSSYDISDFSRHLNEYEFSILSSVEGYYGILKHRFSQESYLSRKILEDGEVSIDSPELMLPDFDIAKWAQNGTLVTFDSPEGRIDFVVPQTFSLARTSRSLLYLVETVLLSPWHQKYANEWVPIRRPGNKPGLSFSGGLDSTAALCLMPDNSHLFYMERNFPSMIKHDNAHFFASELEKSGRSVIIVPSNHEKIRTNHGKNPGFSTDYACMAHLILLADHYDLDAAATGMPLENSYFFHGLTVRDFAETRFWKHHSSIFSYIGLPIYQPVAGCSEILTSIIVAQSEYEHLSTSCLRSKAIGEKCEVCWKCFRKNIFNNKPWKMSNEISKFLAKRPLKQGLATLYALQMLKKSGEQIPEEAADLEPLLSHDLEFLKNYWAPSLDLIPKKYMEDTRRRINTYSMPMEIDLMSIDREISSGLRGEMA